MARCFYFFIIILFAINYQVVNSSVLKLFGLVLKITVAVWLFIVVGSIQGGKIMIRDWGGSEVVRMGMV